MNIVRLTLLTGMLFAAACTPVNERVTILLGKVSVANGLIDRLEQKDYQRGEESAGILAQLDNAIVDIRNTMKDASKEVAKNGKKSQAVLDAMETLRNDLTTLVGREINVSIETIPAWDLAYSQQSVANIQKNFGEIVGYYSTIYPSQNLRASAKRISLSVDRDLLDTMPICQSKFRQLGIINALANKVTQVYNSQTQRYDTVVQDYTSCVWSALGSCSHQMDLACLNNQILNSVVVNLLTADSCSGITYLVSNSIRNCQSSVPVLRSSYNGY